LTNLEFERRRRGLSQHDLAQLAGIDRSLVCRLERQDREPTKDQARRLGLVLDVDPHYLQAGRS
jgi:transcriptional regulator with XRE-family HTH domain